MEVKVSEEKWYSMSRSRWRSTYKEVLITAGDNQEAHARKAPLTPKKLILLPPPNRVMWPLNSSKTEGRKEGVHIIMCV